VLDLVNFAADVVHAAAEGSLAASRVAAASGKAATALAEAFSGGHIAISDLEAVLRNAKLKAPQI
jgi:hypothetical protein